MRPGLAIGAARYVEDNDLASAELTAQERFDFWVILPLHGIVVVKVLDCGRVMQQLEPFSVDGQIVGDLAHVRDGNSVRLGIEEDFRLASGERGTMEHRIGVLATDEIQGCPDFR